MHPLLAGEVVVVHTDGVSEARDAAGVFYPVLERLAQRFGGESAPDPADVVSFVQADTERWSKECDDDQAVLALTLGEHPW